MDNQCIDVAVVGIGMEGDNTLTQAGRRAIEAAEWLVGAERMLRPFRSLGKRELVCYQPTAAMLRECGAEKIAVLVSGDTGFYSAARGLTDLPEDFRVTFCCGIATPVYFASKLGYSWADMCFVNLHGVKASIVRNVCASRLTFFLLGGDITPAALCRRLCEYGRGALTVHIGENFGMPDEHLVSGRAETLTEVQTGRLCAAIVENPDAERGVTAGIPEGQWIRGSIPMTKAEVRACAVAGLRIGAGDVCWDIGCGTGSVAVEMALQSPAVSVYAVDKHPDAISLTEQNARRFGCDNLFTLHEQADIAVETLPPPDCVFVGGSGGQLEKVVHAAAEKNPEVRVAVTAISLETLHECTTLFDALGWDCVIRQIAVTRTRKVGSHTMLSAENPIFLIERGREV